MRHPEEYDDQIPNVTLAEFVLEEMKKFGDDVACVCFGDFLSRYIFIPS